MVEKEPLFGTADSPTLQVNIFCSVCSTREEWRAEKRGVRVAQVLEPVKGSSVPSQCPYTLRLEYLSNIGRWLLWVKTIRFFLYSMQLCQNKHFVSHFHYQVKNLKNYWNVYKKNYFPVTNQGTCSFLMQALKGSVIREVGGSSVN